MADIESNINLDIDASGALASLKELQRQISVFQTTMAKTGSISNARLSDMQNNLVNNINATGQFTASIQRVKTTTESFTQALEKNKLSMGQYFRYSLGATKTFGKGFKTEFDTIEKVARERVKTLQTQYIKLGRDASGAMQAIAVRPQVLDMKDLGTQTAIAAQKAQLFNQLMQQGSTNLLNFGKNTQWAGRQLMVGFTIPLGIMGAAAAKEFQKIEEQVIRLERVYGDFTTTMADTEQITQQIKDLGSEFTKYGVAVSKTIGLAADAAAMGKTGADLVAQVAEANRLAVLGGVDQAQSLETTISLTNAFGVAADQLSGKINFLNAVENQTVTSIEDLTEAIPKAGPVVQQLGGNVEDLTFFLTAMKEGGINASEGANALKSGLASLINPTGEAADMLAGFGINLQGIVEANKGNVRGIVVDFAKALDTLDPLNRAQAIEQLFGKFQFSRLSTLFQNVIAEGSQASRVLDLTKASAAELASLSERELGRIEASPLFKYQAAIENFKAAIAPIGEEFMKAVTPLINFGTQILEGFNSWSDGAKQFAIIAAGAVGAIGPVLLMTFGLLANGLANIVKGILFVRNGFKGLGGQSNVLTEQLNYMNTEQLEAASISASLNQVHNNLIQTFTAEAGSVRNLAAAYGAAIAQQGAFMGPITTRGGGTKKVGKFAQGGIMRGPGTGTSDSILALVSNGEAIIPAATVQKFPGVVDGLISGNIPGFRSGKRAERGGSSGRAGKSGVTISRPYGQNVSNTGGILGFGDISSTDAADVANIYTDQIMKSAGVTFKDLELEINNWRTANLEAIEKATAAVESGVKPAEAYRELLNKFKTDMQKAGGPVSKFTATAKTMMPQLTKDLEEAQSYAKKMKLDVKTAADATKLAQKLPNNIVAQGMATPGSFQTRAKARQAATAMLGRNKVDKYGIPRFMLTPGLEPETRAYKLGTSQEHFSETEAHAANLAKLRGEQVDTANKKKVKAIEKETKQVEERVKDPKKVAAGIKGAETRKANAAAKLASLAEEEVSQAKQTRMQKLRSAVSPGKLGMAGMVAGGALSAASMMGGPVGDVAGQLGGPLMAISGLTSVIGMIPGPAGIAVGALMAVGAGLFALDQHARKMNESAMKTADAMSSGQAAMDKFAAATGKMNPTNVVAQQELAESTGRQADLTDNSFGAQYLNSEEGKSYVSELKSGLLKEGRSAMVGNVVEQLGSAMSAGIMSGDEAQSIIDNLAVQLKDSSLAVSISGQLKDLIGVNGEDLKNNPLEVSVRLIEAKGEDLKSVLEGTDFSSAAPVWFFGATDEAMAERAYNEAQTAKAMSDIVDQEKLALANAKLRNDEKIKELQAAGDIAGLTEQQKKYEAEKLAIQKTSAEQLKLVQDKLNSQTKAVVGRGGFAGYTTDAATAGIIDKLEEDRKARFANEPEDVKNMANKTIESFANTDQLKAGTKATLLATVDVENIEVFNDLKKFFPPDKKDSEQVYDYVASVSTNMGAEAGSDVAEVISLFGDDKERTKNFIANFDLQNPEQLNTVLDAKEILEGIGEEFNIDLFVNDQGEATDKLKNVESAYAEIQAAVDSGGPIVLEQLTFIDQAGLNLMGANQAWFDSLPAEQQKLFLQRYVTVFETVSDKDATAWYAKQIGASGGNKMSADAAERKMSSVGIGTIRAAYAANAAKEYATNFNTPGTTSTNPPPGSQAPAGGGGGGSQEPQKPPTSFLDSLVKDMRDFTNATQNLTENFQDSMSAIRSSAASAFGGLSQQLRGVGVGEDVISIMTGMSKEEWDQYKGQFFNFDAAGNVTGFKADLTAIADKLRTITLGKFVDEQQKSLVNLAAQNKALTSLVGLGMSYANAYKLIEDAALATAIANAKSADEIRRIIALAEQARKAQSLADASKNVANANATTDATVAGLNALIRFNGALSDTQTAAILADNDLQTMLANFDTLTVDQLKVLNEALQDAADKEALEIKIKMQTKEGMQELFNDGFSKAMEQFSAKEQTIKIKFKALKDPFEDIVSSFSNQIEDLKNTPGGLDDLEADLQRIGEQEIDINKKYDERYKALDSISKINERVAAQQRTQLSLAEALSQGDIAAAARAAEEMRANDAAQALVDQREALQKSQQLEIDNLTATMGLTREQIEARVRDIKRQIFEIEEQQIEPAQRQIELLTRQEELQISALTVAGKTREEWDNIKAAIDLARTNSQQYQEAVNLALTIVQDLEDAWKEIEKPKQTIHTIIEKRITEAQAATPAPAPAPAPVASTAPAPAADYHTEEYRNNMARAVIRGEYGNGQARRNNLGADYQWIQDRVNDMVYHRNGYATGGLVSSYFANGGMTKPMFAAKGTDTVPAMLTPGEFVVRKWAVDRFGVDNLKAINQGNFGSGSVYNYNMSVNVRSDANPDEIARTVMAQIKRVDAQRVRGNRF